MRHNHLNYPLTHFIENLLTAIKAAGGRPLLVGGCVRDALMGASPKDIDIEVFGIGVKDLKRVLYKQGRVVVVGSSFGVIKVTLPDGTDLDVTLPCRATVKGQRGVLAEIDSTTTPREAASRRDFTINAMAYDFESHELLDFYGGQADLKAGILRHVGPAFAEDPLRVLRAMQFAARWRFVLAPETIAFCAKLRPEYHAIAKERVWGEWEKLLKKSVQPSSGLLVLEQIGWLSLYHQLDNLVTSTGWAHSLRMVDNAARICERDGLTGEARAVMILAALCINLDKITVASLKPFGNGSSEAEVSEVEHFLINIGCTQQIARQVIPLSREYLMEAECSATPRTVRHLAQRLFPATIEQWERVMEAGSTYRLGHNWLKLAQEMNCANRPVEPLLLGRHLKEIGLTPGPQYRSILDGALEAQINGVFSTLEEAQAWLTSRLNS